MADLTQLLKSYREFRGSRPAGKGTVREESPPPNPQAPAASASSQAAIRPEPDPPAPPMAAAATPPTHEASPQAAATVPQAAPPTHEATPGDRSAPSSTLYSRALHAVSQFFEAAVMESIAPGRLRSTTVELEETAVLLVEATKVDDDLLRLAMGIYPQGEGFILPHSVNVAILAVQIGRELGLERYRLITCCMAGLTHDVGSVRLPDGMLYKTDSLTPGEWETMKRRPRYGHDILRALGEPYEPTAEIVLQVYERMDGSGYPMGLRGEDILTEARILGAVDFFEAFVHPRPYKSILTGTANYGVQTLMQMADKFGREVLKGLVRCVGLFPIGTYVCLSTGEVAEVIAFKKRNPMRPVVRVLIDGNGKPTKPPRDIELVDTPHIYISRPLAITDLEKLGLVKALHAGTAAGPDRTGQS
ncbi:MAG: HD-GYP domain-containing protein [Acidobacteriota bacterium]